MSRLKGVGIECIGWNPSQPTASTREILVGASDGNVYEVYIEPSSEFYRREEKYVKGVYKISDSAVTGLWIGETSDQVDWRRILVASQARLLYFDGFIGRTGAEGSGSVYSKLFESEQPFQYDSEAHINYCDFHARNLPRSRRRNGQRGISAGPTIWMALISGRSAWQLASNIQYRERGP